MQSINAGHITHIAPRKLRARSGALLPAVSLSPQDPESVAFTLVVPRAPRAAVLTMGAITKSLSVLRTEQGWLCSTYRGESLVEDADLFLVFEGCQVVRRRVPRSVLAQRGRLRVDVPKHAPNVRFRVVDPDGAAVAQAEVQATARSITYLSTQTITGADGRGLLALDPASGPWRVVVIDPRTRAATVVKNWWLGREERDVRLQPPTKLRFRLVFEDGAPARGAYVQFGGWPSVHRAISDDDGWIETAPLVPALYELHIRAIDRRGELPRHGDTHHLTRPAEEIRTGQTLVLERR